MRQVRDGIPLTPEWSDDTALLATYWSARGLLAGIGVPYPVARLVQARAEAVRVSGELAGPLVLKADWIAHRTDVGGVVLGLSGAEAVGAAYDELAGRLGERGFVLEEMDRRDGVVELIVGFRRDPGFGGVVLVGMGGTLAEVYRDTAVELAPVDEELALGMLRGLRGWPLLDGWRGRAPMDVRAVARVVVALSRLAVARPDLAEVEVNPLRVGPDGVLAVDALVVR